MPGLFALSFKVFGNLQTDLWSVGDQRLEQLAHRDAGFSAYGHSSLPIEVEPNIGLAGAQRRLVGAEQLAGY